MIVVDGVLISVSPEGKSSPLGREILASLLELPALISAAERLKATPQWKFSVSDEQSPPLKLVYVFQHEYATVDPNLVHLVGTDEATTCVGLVIRNPRNGMVSVAHMDFVGVVDMGLRQMLSMIVEDDENPILDVHLIGGFEDAPSGFVDNDTGSKYHKHPDGYSMPLCSKILEALHCRPERFQVQTLCVLGHNTKKDQNGNAYPVIGGFLLDTSSGSVFPASFDSTSRVPDEIVRRVRVTVCSMDSSWEGKLLETYDTKQDRFQIASCSWSSGWRQYVLSLQQLSDSEILSQCSTSPAAEPPDFVENERRKWAYMIEYADWDANLSRKETSDI
ncbi:protein N-terminal asparagine amidohydrolase [Dioscorea cayenensis subsp. rotundata]|uniref:Protein N-terminal asparagine amidohydrolase n=1 Tax=Dioscorea cayennensis subsp. rotundata TaxID=55577 RepID=A0AB40B963_DIOCR|nr:protein N-terminal asparagine amidohydrolase [Dioscorea cayenensis subsp. rotundata]